MLTIALNPGFVLLLGALIVLPAPSSMRSPIMALSAIGALLLLLLPDFGRYDAFAQIGLVMVPLRLDALNYVFGLAFIGATVLLAIYASATRRRYEDASILLLAGAATSALFVGDLVSFVAANALAGLAGAFIVFCAANDRASKAGVRLLIWQGLEGLMLLSGVAFLLSDGLRNEFGAMHANSVGGGLFLAGLLLRVGAPLAHVWLKDAVSHATPAGSAALAIYAPMVGLYGLARAFAGEPLLVDVALGMMAIGAVFACADDDLRKAFAYSLLAQMGVAMAAIGLGGPAALSAAAAHGFSLIFAYLALFMALGAFVAREDTASAAGLAGAGARAPMTAALMFMAGLAAASAPALIGYPTFQAVLQAARGARLMPDLLPLALQATAGLAITHTTLRPLLAVLAPANARGPEPTPTFPMLLASALALFLCVVIGLAPGWLFALTPPAPLAFSPYRLEHLAQHVALLASATAAFLALRLLGLAREKRTVMLDIDALYRGPLASMGRWAGVLLLRLYGAWRDASAVLARWAAAAFASFAQAADRPYRDVAAGALHLVVISALLALICAGRLQVHF